jgi:hypothetical protein
MPDFGIFRGFSNKAFSDKLFAGQTPINLGSIDSDVLGFFTRVANAGGILSAIEKQAIIQLVYDLKSYGIWDSMKAIYPMIGASAAACSQNLISSSYTGTFSSGWTFASTGVTPNGTSAFMNTFFNPKLYASSKNSFHFSVYIRSNVNATTIDIGAEQGSYGTFLFPSLSSQTYARLGDSYATLTSILDTKAFFQVIRLSTTNTKYFLNNVKKADSIVSLTDYPNYNIYLGALNSNGSTTLYSNRQNAFASIGDGLTDTQASNFYTAVQAMQTTLSRQV